MKGPLRVGVVGLGRWATAAHLPALAEDPRWEIAALADSDPQRREEAGGLFPAARTFPDLPAKNLTFTLMANATRIAEQAF